MLLQRYYHAKRYMFKVDRPPQLFALGALLLASKADPSLANGRGKTPLDVAAQLGHAEIVALFEQHEEEQEAAWRNQ